MHTSISNTRDAQTQRTIRHCERWIQLIDLVMGLIVITMLSAGIGYWVADSTSIKNLQLIIIWSGLVILALLLIAQLVVTSAMSGARHDLYMGGEEGFDEHVNRLMDKRELRNDIKKRMN